MNNLSIVSEVPSLFVNRDDFNNSTDSDQRKNVVSFYKKSVKYSSLPLPEKWRYRKAVNNLQVLINKIQSEEISNLEDFEYNLPEVVNLLKIRKEMLTCK